MPFACSASVGGSPSRGAKRSVGRRQGAGPRRWVDRTSVEGRHPAKLCRQNGGQYGGQPADGNGFAEVPRIADVSAEEPLLGCKGIKTASDKKNYPGAVKVRMNDQEFVLPHLHQGQTRVVYAVGTRYVLKVGLPNRGEVANPLEPQPPEHLGREV